MGSRSIVTTTLLTSFILILISFVFFSSSHLLKTAAAMGSQMNKFEGPVVMGDEELVSGSHLLLEVTL